MKGILLFALLSVSLSFEIQANLKFNTNKKFRILQMTDLHFGEDETKDQNSIHLQEKLINATKPDLVVITGDSVSGYAWDNKDQEFYQRNWKKWTSAFQTTQVKYAYTLGNHDDQGNYSRQQIIDIDKTHPYSITKQSRNITGITNYIIPIVSANNDKKAVTILWFFDTNDEGCLGHSGWGCLNPDQIQWYQNVSQQIVNCTGSNVKGLGFFHIPLPEYRSLWNFGLTYGNRHEGVCSPDFNTGFFDKAVQIGNLEAVFCGHDHSNDYGGMWKDIELVYGRKTGYGGYGPDGLQRGARIIDLQENNDGSFNYTHMVIQEDLTIIPNGNPTWQGARYVTNCDG